MSRSSRINLADAQINFLYQPLYADFYEFKTKMTGKEKQTKFSKQVDLIKYLGYYIIYISTCEYLSLSISLSLYILYIYIYIHIYIYIYCRKLGIYYFHVLYGFINEIYTKC